MSIFSWFKHTIETDNGVAADYRDGSASDITVLVLSSSKKNQNFYRDQELAKQGRGVFLTENFYYEGHNWDISSIVESLFTSSPVVIFVNYSHLYTYRLTGFDRVDGYIIGFVGDHYNFIDESENAIKKQQFFQSLPLTAMSSAYPATNQIVANALGKPDLPFIDFHWAIDTAVFHDRGGKRPYDIACMGALTEGKYPFRRQVRAWLESNKRLKLFKKKRVKGKAGSDHDGEAFNAALNKCKAVFSCASAMQYTLMKYFEIPATGALLFGERTPDLEKLGYMDGINFIEVTPENYAEKIEYYLLGDGRKDFETIRKAGYRLATEVNTWEKRVQAFLDDLNKLTESAS